MNINHTSKNSKFNQNHHLFISHQCLDLISPSPLSYSAHGWSTDFSGWGMGSRETALEGQAIPLPPLPTNCAPTRVSFPGALKGPNCLQGKSERGPVEEGCPTHLQLLSSSECPLVLRIPT